MQNTPNNVLRSIQMLDENTVEVRFNDKVLIDLEDIKITYDQLNNVTQGRRLRKIVVTGKGTQITKEARIFGHEASLKLKDQIIAEAIVVNSLYQKMVINFYSKFIKGLYPSKYFDDFELAKNWLKQYD